MHNLDILPHDGFDECMFQVFVDQSFFIIFIRQGLGPVGPSSFSVHRFETIISGFAESINC